MALICVSGRFLQANPAFCELVGRTEQELLGLIFFDVVHPGDRDLARARHEQRVSGALASGRLEMRFLHADGHPVWTRVMDAPVKDDDGQLLYTLTQVLDLSEQRRLEETTSRLYALSRDLFCTLGFDGYFKSVNPAWERVLGYTADQLLTRPMLDFVHPDDRPRTARESGRLKRSDEVTISFESRFRTRDGSYRWLLWSAHVSPEERLVYGVAKDVTERKRSEERLRESERKYRDLVETSSDLIWSVDPQGRFTFVNRAVRRIYGYEPEEMLGRPLTDFAPPGGEAEVRERLRQILRGRPLFSSETRHVRKDGSIVYLSYNAIVLHDSEGNLLGATGTATDVTEQRRSEARQAAVTELGRRALEGHEPHRAGRGGRVAGGRDARRRVQRDARVSARGRGAEAARAASAGPRTQPAAASRPIRRPRSWPSRCRATHRWWWRTSPANGASRARWRCPGSTRAAARAWRSRATSGRSGCSASTPATTAPSAPTR